MLRLRQVSHLARHLGTSARELENALDIAASFYEKLILLDPAKPGKRREVVCVKGQLRNLQSKFYRRVLLPALTPSPHSHGGVRGRHIKSNAEVHRRSSYVFKTDISDFYPTIHHSRIYQMFVERFGCSPDVARLCTKLCTYKHHLALGLVTSPILADQLLYRVDLRIGAACMNAGLVYTRYVDDVTVSGQYNLQSSGFERLITEILGQDGFRVNVQKNQFAELSKRTAITGVRIHHGRLDVRREYADELDRQLDDAWRLSHGHEFEGPYYTEGQIRGRVQFVSWVNPGRKPRLMRKFRSIPWSRVADIASERELVATQKALHRPDPLVPIDVS